MPHEMNSADSSNVVKPRIHGRSATRIKSLAIRTGISESRVANMAVDAGIAVVEKQLRCVCKVIIGK